MSLSARDQQALTSIEHRLAGSDPRLASLLSGFTRLASGEEMPGREKIQVRWWWAVRRWLPSRWLPTRRGPARRWPARRGRISMRTRQAVLLVWLLIAIAMIAVALGLDRGSGTAACKTSWPTVCTSHAPGHGSVYAAG